MCAMVGSMPVPILARYARITWKIMTLFFSLCLPTTCGVFELRRSHVIGETTIHKGHKCTQRQREERELALAPSDIIERAELAVVEVACAV